MLTPLNESQIKDYHEKGFIILKPFEEEELCAFDNSLQKTIKAFIQKANEEHNTNVEVSDEKLFDEGMVALEDIDHFYVSQVYNCICHSPEFVRLAFNAQVSRASAQLLGGSPDHPVYSLTQACRIDIARETPYTFNWHQEVFYTVPKSTLVQTWAPLVRDSSDSNGTLQVAIGSHKEGIAEQDWIVKEGVPDQITVRQDVVDKYETRSVSLKRGEILLFSGRLFHRSGVNTSGKTRFSMVGSLHDIEKPEFLAPRFSAQFPRMSLPEYYKEVFGREPQSS